MLLIAAAKHLGTGSAVGVDIWSVGDLTGAAMESAKLEGVLDRVTVKEGDAALS